MALPTSLKSPSKSSSSPKSQRGKQTTTTGKTDKDEPGIIILAPNHMNFKDYNPDEIREELKKGRHLKYIHQNKKYMKDTVRNMILEKRIKLDSQDIYYMEINRFKNIKNGIFYKLDAKQK